MATDPVGTIALSRGSVTAALHCTTLHALHCKHCRVADDDDDEEEEEEPIDEADESAAPPSQIEAPLASSAVAAKQKVRVAIAMPGPWHCGTAKRRCVHPLLRADCLLEVPNAP